MAIEMYTVIIAKDQVLSPSFDARRGRLNAIVMPDDWDGEYVSFQMSPSMSQTPGPEFFDIYDANGREVIITVLPNTVVVAPTIFAGHIKLRSGPSERPVPQVAARSFVFVYDPAQDVAPGPRRGE